MAKIGTHKRCAKCREVKPVEEFGSNETSGDGRQSYCKGCRNKVHIKRREVDPMHRIKHHFTTRIQKQLGSNCPLDLFSRFEDYVGYKMTSLVLKLNREVQENYGLTIKQAFEAGYHIDHEKPMSKFPVTRADSQVFRDCWAISNLKLIPAQDNLKKGAKYTETAKTAKTAGNIGE